MKVLIEVRRETWGSVKEYATLRKLKLGRAVDKLLQLSLSQSLHANQGQNNGIE
jgi:hypothetical protein